jgi:hypothetical protein
MLSKLSCWQESAAGTIGVNMNSASGVGVRTGELRVKPERE